MKKLLLICVVVLVVDYIVENYAHSLIIKYASCELQEGLSSNTGSLENMPVLDILVLVPVAAFFEELIFRFTPFILFFGIVISIRDEIPSTYISFRSWTVIIALLSSFVFGYAHGNILNIFLQGIGGLSLAYIFIKTIKTLTEDEDIYDFGEMASLCFLATIMTTLVHSAWNFSLAILG